MRRTVTLFKLLAVVTVVVAILYGWCALWWAITKEFVWYFAGALGLPLAGLFSAAMFYDLRDRWRQWK